MGARRCVRAALGSPQHDACLLRRATWATNPNPDPDPNPNPNQGDMGDAIYFLDVGECVAKIQLLSFEVGEPEPEPEPGPEPQP